MDFSGYDGNWVALKMKQMVNTIANFIALKPKVIYTKKKQTKNSNGVPKQKVKKELAYNYYNETLEYNNCDTVTFNSIKSKAHQIYNIHQSSHYQTMTAKYIGYTKP